MGKSQMYMISLCVVSQLSGSSSRSHSTRRLLRFTDRVLHFYVLAEVSTSHPGKNKVSDIL